MGKTITVKPNQSMLDIILMSTGSLEAAIQFCKEQNVSLTDIPIVGTEYKVNRKNDNWNTDEGVTKYLDQNGIIIGTLGDMPPTPPLPAWPLNMAVAMKPTMNIVSLTSTLPSVLGYYYFELQEKTTGSGGYTGFINRYPLVANYSPGYPNNNHVFYEPESSLISGSPASSLPEYLSQPMTDKKIRYGLPWTSGTGKIFVWGANVSGVETATFEDINGNTARWSPVIVLKANDQVIDDCLIADIKVDLISSTSTEAILRIARKHDPATGHSFYTPYGAINMSWTGAAAGGVPDPSDPGNTNKTVITVPAGIYKIGVSTTYVNNLIGGFTYPNSVAELVLEVS